MLLPFNNSHKIKDRQKSIADLRRKSIADLSSSEPLPGGNMSDLINQITADLKKQIDAFTPELELRDVEGRELILPV